MLTDGTQYTRGQVMLKKFTNEQALSKEGSNLYSNLDNAEESKAGVPRGVMDLGVLNRVRLNYRMWTLRVNSQN